MGGSWPATRLGRRLWLAGLVGLGLALVGGLGRLPAAQAGGAIVVDTTADEMTVNGKCSLREAVQAANTHGAVDTCLGQPGTNIIVLSGLTYKLTIPKTGANDNTSGNLNLTSNINLGPNPCGGICFSTIISGGPGWDDQILNISNNAQVTLSQVTIQGGSTEGYGGGAFVQSGWLVLTDTTFYNNRSESGGGGLATSLSNLTVINSRFVSNTALSGGGFYSLGARIEVRHSIFMSNTASRFGGGAIGMSGVALPASLTVTDSSLIGNLAANTGGAVNTTATSVSLSNTTVSGNSAANGGGLYMDRSSLDLDNVTVAHNTASFDGGGIGAINGVTITLANSLVALNTDLAAPMNNDCSTSVTSRGYNLIGDTTGCTITGSTSGNRLGVDPLLLPLTLSSNGWVHPLHFLSPALDGGSPAAAGQPNACAGRDQRGLARPVDGDGDSAPVCDMGAYELQTTTVIRRLQLPALHR